MADYFFPVYCQIVSRYGERGRRIAGRVREIESQRIQSDRRAGVIVGYGAANAVAVGEVSRIARAGHVAWVPACGCAPVAASHVVDNMCGNGVEANNVHERNVDRCYIVFRAPNRPCVEGIRKAACPVAVVLSGGRVIHEVGDAAIDREIGTALSWVKTAHAWAL